jgi:hypothetical protein
LVFCAGRKTIELEIKERADAAKRMRYSISGKGKNYKQQTIEQCGVKSILTQEEKEDIRRFEICLSLIYSGIPDNAILGACQFRKYPLYTLCLFVLQFNILFHFIYQLGKSYCKMNIPIICKVPKQTNTTNCLQKTL